MLRDAIRDELRLRYGLNDSDDFFTDAILNGLINASGRAVSQREAWPWLNLESTESISVGSPGVAPTNFRSIRWIRYEGKEIARMNPREAHIYYDQTGPPERYTDEGVTVRVYPSPDATYSIDVGYVLDRDPDLSDDVTESTIPEWAISLLILQTLVSMARRSNDRDKEVAFYRELALTRKDLQARLAASTEGMLPNRPGDRWIGGLSR